MSAKTDRKPQFSPDEEEVVRKCVSILSEHFDVTQVLVSKTQTDGSTRMIQRGSGNYYARVYMCQAYADRAKAEHVGDFVAQALRE